MDYLLPAHCRVDIYDVDDKSKYVECAKMRSWFGVSACIAIYVIIAIILIIFASGRTFLIFTAISSVVILLTLVDYLYLAEWRAGGEYDSYDYELKRIIKDNPSYSIGEAKDVIRRERLVREQIRAQKEAASKTADAINNQTFALTGLFKQNKRK